MKARITITSIWLGGLIICLILVELYFQRTVDGIPFLFPDSRAQYLQPISIIYGIYIAGILGAWYVRRFIPLHRDSETRTLFIIALVCTLLWNIGIIYLIGQRHIYPYGGGTLESDLSTAVKFGKWFSFIVWPVNVYYFGIKPQSV